MHSSLPGRVLKCRSFLGGFRSSETNFLHPVQAPDPDGIVPTGGPILECSFSVNLALRYVAAFVLVQFGTLLAEFLSLFFHAFFCDFLGNRASHRSL
ncbi:hypothetical protein COPR103792_06915 [Corynebacterium propinquum]